MTAPTEPQAQVLGTERPYAVVLAAPDAVLSVMADAATEALVQALERPATARLVHVEEAGGSYRATYLPELIGARS